MNQVAKRPIIFNLNYFLQSITVGEDIVYDVPSIKVLNYPITGSFDP